MNPRPDLRVDALYRALGRVNMQIAFRNAPTQTLLRHFAIYILPPILLLILAHYLIIVVFNLSPLFLRLASLVIPLPFGATASDYGQLNFRVMFGVGFLIAVVSVACMLAIIGIIDEIQIIPASLLEWRETVEYSLSIGLAFLTGAILLHIVLTALPATINGGDRPSVLAMRMARSLGGHTSSEGLRRRARRIQNLIRTIGPLGGVLATAGGSVYTGLKSVIT